MRANGIKVIVGHGKKDTPSAVFVNNWFSSHCTNNKNQTEIVVYPMFDPHRRTEVRIKYLEELLKENGIEVSRVINLTGYTKENKALESTGSSELKKYGKLLVLNIKQIEVEGGSARCILGEILTKK